MKHFMLAVIFIIFLLSTEMAGAGSGWLRGILEIKEDK
jgi:hypothetical protein